MGQTDQEKLNREIKRDESKHRSGLDGLRGRPANPDNRLPFRTFSLDFPWLGKVDSDTLLHEPRSAPQK